MLMLIHEIDEMHSAGGRDFLFVSCIKSQCVRLNEIFHS